jgi:hypothetical protein
MTPSRFSLSETAETPEGAGFWIAGGAPSRVTASGAWALR